MSSHANDPGSIPGLEFPFDKADLVVSIVVQISVISSVNRMADMATPDAAVREVPGSIPEQGKSF